MTENAQLDSRRLFTALLLVLSVLVAAVLQAASLAPAVPRETDRCPVCGTLVAPHQDWLAQVHLADGSTLFFEGAKDMFRYLRSPESYSNGVQSSEVVGGFVTTWYDHRAVPIEDAWFVIGSDVTGPAGEELVAHPSLSEANRFVIEHGGMRICDADDISTALLSKLR